MGKIATVFEPTDHSMKWGIVQVRNKDGSINRQYQITAKEAQAVFDGNNILPPGCTEEEWFSGRTVVAAKHLNPGQVTALEDGTLVVNQGIDTTNDRVTIDLLAIPPQKWDITDKVNIDDTIPIKAAYKAEVTPIDPNPVDTGNL